MNCKQETRIMTLSVMRNLQSTPIITISVVLVKTTIPILARELPETVQKAREKERKNVGNANDVIIHMDRARHLVQGRSFQ